MIQKVTSLLHIINKCVLKMLKTLPLLEIMKLFYLHLVEFL